MRSVASCAQSHGLRVRASAATTALGLTLIAVAACQHHAVIAARVEPTVEQGVAGKVFDSLAAAPLAAARVELVDAVHPEQSPRELISDSSGAFAARDVAPGRYVATFYHPRLDSLGVQSSSFLVDLRGRRGVWLSLAIPSPARLRAMFCGDHLTDSTGMLIGRAIDARTQSGIEGAVVTAQWLDVDAHPGRSVLVHRPYTQTTSRSDGSFTLCDVPLFKDFGVHADQPGKRSGTIGLKLTESGIARRDLLLADSQHVIVHGNVLGGNGAPVPRAHVSAIDMPGEATADENGVFALPVERGGTQTLVVRALGYYPEERTVDIRPDSGAWVELDLPTRVSALDTTHVRANRSADYDGFERRRAGGIGTFLTSADIEATIPRSLTDLISRSPATPLVRLPDGHLGVSVRGASCLPVLVLNGHSLPMIHDLIEIDNLVDLAAIARMEIYTAGEIPPQYTLRTTCAAILVWTKRPGDPR